MSLISRLLFINSKESLSRYRENYDSSKFYLLLINIILLLLYVILLFIICYLPYLTRYQNFYNICDIYTRTSYLPNTGYKIDIR